MKLLAEHELIWSDIVANSRMNRERNASGINSYEKEFGFKPEDFLKERINRNGQAKWLDLCCGQGKALIQVATLLAGEGLQEKAHLKGIDLVDAFLPLPPALNCLRLEAGSITGWQTDDKYDLITCVHGLHYVGDKLKVLQQAFAALNPEGLFVANLDLDNIRITGKDTAAYLKQLFSKQGIRYNGRTRILTCQGRKTIEIDLHYVGADDRSGPNYTGQEAVTSFYTL
jgi:SAM-dependent methyltransferase